MNSKRGIQQYFQTAKAHAKVGHGPPITGRGCDLILGTWPRLMGFPVPVLWLTCVQNADTILGISMQTHAQDAVVSTLVQEQFVCRKQTCFFS